MLWLCPYITVIHKDLETPCHNHNHKTALRTSCAYIIPRYATTESMQGTLHLEGCPQYIAMLSRMFGQFVNRSDSKSIHDKFEVFTHIFTTNLSESSGLTAILLSMPPKALAHYRLNRKTKFRSE